MLKDCLAQVFWMLSLPKWRFRELAREGAFIMVNYHRICDLGFGGIQYPAYYDLRTSPLLFAEHLAFFGRYFDVTTLDEALHFQPGAKPKLVITLDDGYADNFHFAMPILEKHKFPALVYVATQGLAGTELLWDNQIFYSLQVAGSVKLRAFFQKNFDLDLEIQTDDQLSQGIFHFLTNQIHSQAERMTIVGKMARETDSLCPKNIFQSYYLNGTQLREMEKNDMQIGSHTRSHALLASSTADEVKQELERAKVDLEKILGHEVHHFCYPSGNFNEQVANEVHANGYHTAATVMAGKNGPQVDRFKLKRNGISGQTNTYLGFELSGWKERLVSLRGKRN